MTDEEAKSLQKLLLRELADPEASFTGEEWGFMNEMYRAHKAEYRQVLRKAKALLSLTVSSADGAMKL